MRVRRHPSHQTLSRYVDEELTEVRRAEVDAHLEGCLRCQREIDFMVEEMTRMRARGSRIFLVPAFPVNGVPPSHASWDRVWAAACDLGMAPMPAPVRLTDNGQLYEVCDDNGKNCVGNLDKASVAPKALKNPGYPFYIPGIAGSRAPHPPASGHRESPEDPAPALPACRVAAARPRNARASGTRHR